MIIAFIEDGEIKDSLNLDEYGDLSKRLARQDFLVDFLQTVDKLNNNKNNNKEVNNGTDNQDQ